MNSTSAQPSLRDFLRPILRGWLIIVAAIVVAVVASIVYSALQNPVYTAKADLSFQDSTRDLGLVGLAAAPTQTPQQLATASAPTVVQPEVVSAVKRQLHSSQSIDKLAGGVTTVVNANSALVEISARESTAAKAQTLANAFAEQTAAVANRNARATYAAEFRALLRHRPPKAAGPEAVSVYHDQLGRLGALATIAAPAQVADVARPPGSPTSPRPVRNALLAAALGLVLALLIVFVRDSFDRRFRTLGDVQDEFGYTLVGHVREEAMGRRAVPGDNDTRVSRADWELFRILRRNVEFINGGAPLKTIAVTSSLAEEGKSTVATFLAFATAAAGKRTLLIECDLRRPVLAERLGVNESPGLTDYVQGRATPSDIIQTITFIDPASQNGGGPRPATEIHESGYRLVVITAGTPTKDPVEILGAERFRTMLTEVQSHYDVVIFDTTPLLSVVDALELLPDMSAVLMCVRVSKITRDQVRAGKAALDRLPERPLGLVVTGMRRGEAREYGYYGYYPS